MSDNYNENSKRQKLDVDLLQDTYVNNENEEDDFDSRFSSVNSADIQPNEHRDYDIAPSSPSFSDDVSFDDKLDDINRNKSFTWGPINPEWMKSAKELKVDRIYVHGNILEWILEYLDQNFLDDQLRATVEEVFHHNLDGDIYLINFYIETKCKNFTRKRSIKAALEHVMHELQYKCSWENRPTYFLKCDSTFADQSNQLKQDLREIHVHDSFSTTTVDVNWLYIPKIQIYVFPEYLTDAQTNQIDNVFNELSVGQSSSLYICKQFKWHNDGIVGDYVEVNKLVMDVCAENWFQCGWFEKLQIKEILDLDLAFKDYRNPYCNRNVEKDIDKLLKKLLPELAPDNDKKLIFNFDDTLPSYACEYFVSKFFNKITSTSTVYYNNLISKYDISTGGYGRKEIHLTRNKPTEDELLNEDHPNIVYNISNYYNFSDALFRALLNKRNTMSQTFKIHFDEYFNFEYPEKIDEPLALSSLQTLIIELINCIENNADQLENFMKYLIGLFTGMPKLKPTILIIFLDCKLHDYSFLVNIGSYIDCIKFENMKLPSSQFKVLSRSLSQQTKVRFTDCNDITDTDVMTLLENIDFENLMITGKNGCTLAVIFLIAERIMNSKSVDSPIYMRQFINIAQMSGIFKYIFETDYNLNNLLFTKIDDQIVIFAVKSKEIVNLIDKVNEILIN